MLKLLKYDTIHKIDPEHWDSLLSEEEVFHTYRFISIVEDSRVEQAQFFYLLFYDGNELVATTVLSAFSISLDLLVGDVWLVRKLKQFFPKLFSTRILICGLPASFGQLNLAIKNEKFTADVCALLSEEMITLARTLKIKFLAVKELKEKQLPVYHHFLKNGFFLANSIPYMSMPVCWESFEQYMNALRHPYRRKIRLSLQKIYCNTPVIKYAGHYSPQEKQPVLVISEPGWMGAGAFYRLYLDVMSRSTTKLETLNEEFFQKFFEDRDACQLLSLMVNERVIASAMIVYAGKELTFMLIGRKEDKDEWDSYFNLLYGIIALAIEKRCTRINLGQTAYWAKQCVGGLPENEYFFFASTGKLWHRILKVLKRLIFPKPKLENLRVFKDIKEFGQIILHNGS